MNGLLHKARKPKFELTLQIIDLNNVPLVAGQSYIKWYLPMSKAAEHRGVTSKQQIKDYKVTWDFEKKLMVRLSTDKTRMLQECHIDFEVIQEFNGSGRDERVTIGRVRLNLAEYADIHGDDGQAVVRRYLMQDSKINSTVKIGLGMLQVEGDRNFIAPPLKTASVFEGFTGVIASEQEPDTLGHLGPGNLLNGVGELQDMYRLTLAAQWSCGTGVLTADKCIEDIFNGGDGWGNKPPPKSENPSLHPMPSAHSEDEGMGTETPQNYGHQLNRRNVTSSHTESSAGRRHTQAAQKSRRESEMPGLSSTIDKKGNKVGGISKSSALGLDGDKPDDSSISSSSSFIESQGFKLADEVAEWTAREDLRAWKIPIMPLEESGAS